MYSTVPWKIINERIKRCKSLSTSEDKINCLKILLKEFGEDGMILYELGVEYEAIGKYADAIAFYTRALNKFPLPKYKSMALKSIERVKTLIKEGHVNEKTLYIVNCTQKKIWNENPDAPIFIPARFAYKGQSFIEFLKFIKPLEEKDAKWLILSAKYGFIEPWHPITNYNVSFDNPESGPISDETLRNQVLYQKRWKDNKPLRNFKKVMVYGSKIYYEKVKKAYEGIAEVRSLTISKKI